MSEKPRGLIWPGDIVSVEPSEPTATFRKRPVEIQARRLKEEMVIETLEGTMTGKPGDWLIIGVKGEPYPCRDDIFRQTYEPVCERAKKAFADV